MAADSLAVDVKREIRGLDFLIAAVLANLGDGQLETITPCLFALPHGDTTIPE
jgi:hypothetical protein